LFSLTGGSISITIPSSERGIVSFYAGDKITLQTYIDNGFYLPDGSYEFTVNSYNRSTGVLSISFPSAIILDSSNWTIQARGVSGTVSPLDPLSSSRSDVMLIADPQNVSGFSIVPIDNVVFYYIEIPSEAFTETIEKNYYVNSSTYGVGGISITYQSEPIFLVRKLVSGTSWKSFTIKYIPNGDGVVSIYLEAHDGTTSFTWIGEYGG
jgi:hypothetical protein